jgi:hypothetical protein
MTELEEMIIIQIEVSEWIKLKMFERHQIAVCMYHPWADKKKFVVQAFRGREEESCMGPFLRILSIPFTEKKFRRKDIKIAKWYFRELCRSLKDGVFIQEKPKKCSCGRWI